MNIQIIVWLSCGYSQTKGRLFEFHKGMSKIIITLKKYIYNFRYFQQEEKSLSKSLLSEGRYFWNLLTPVKFYRYFRRATTSGGVVTLGSLGYHAKVKQFTSPTCSIQIWFCFICVSWLYLKLLGLPESTQQPRMGKWLFLEIITKLLYLLMELIRLRWLRQKAVWSQLRNRTQSSFLGFRRFPRGCRFWKVKVQIFGVCRRINAINPVRNNFRVV